MFLKILLMLSKQQQLPLEIRNQLSVIGHKLLVADILLRVTETAKTLCLINDFVSAPSLTLFHNSSVLAEMWIDNISL